VLKVCLGTDPWRLGVLLYPQGTKESFDLHLEGLGCLLSAGAPDCPVHTRHCTVANFFPSSVELTVESDVGAFGRLAHQTVLWGFPTIDPADVAATWPPLIARRPMALAELLAAYRTGLFSAHQTVQ
jgi:hypothetical protein